MVIYRNCFAVWIWIQFIQNKKKTTPIKLYFNNCGRKGGLYNFFSVIDFTLKLLNRYFCVFHFVFCYFHFCVCMCMYVHMCMCVHVCMYVYVCVCLRICVYKCVFVYFYIYIYIFIFIKFYFSGDEM